LKSGDLNTKFFHNYASYRWNNKHVWEIKSDIGEVYKGQENIKVMALNHFKKKYNLQNGISTTDQVKVVSLYHCMVDTTEAENLYKPVEKEEINKVLKKFKVDKSPGPNG